MRILAAGLLAICAPAAVAEEIVFQSDDEIFIIRGRDVSGTAAFELVGPDEGQIRCLALDPNERPLASTIGWAEHGEVRFPDLDVDAVDRVACQYQ